LTRYRRKRVESQTAERNRLLKMLETANIKLASVVCDVFGVSGQLMLKALLEGKASPQEMAQLARNARLLGGMPENRRPNVDPKLLQSFIQRPGTKRDIKSPNGLLMASSLGPPRDRRRA
jgi:hypothetical protein